MLLILGGIGACNTPATPPDRSFRVPNWCEPHGCSWGL